MKLLLEILLVVMWWWQQQWLNVLRLDRLLVSTLDLSLFGHGLIEFVNSHPSPIHKHRSIAHQEVH